MSKHLPVGKKLYIYRYTVVDPDPHGSALIGCPRKRIRIGNADPDPGAWNLTKINKYFTFNNSTFVNLKFDQDPDLHGLAFWISGFGFRLGSALIKKEKTSYG
jgi:hypothetical protein